MFGGLFRLVNYENRWGEGPGDKIAILRDVALDANGQAIIDLTGLVKPGAQVDYVLFSRTNVAGTDSLTFGTAGIAYGIGDIGVSLTAVAVSGNEPAVVIPAASQTVLCLIIIDATDIAEA
jgi:hypothetical protein